MTQPTMNDLDWQLSYCLDYYKQQSEATNRIRDRINYTFGLVISPIAAAIYFVYDKGRISDLDLKQQVIFGIPFTLAIISLFVAGIAIFLSLSKSHKYLYPQSPENLTAYYNSLPAPENDNNDNRLYNLKYELLTSLNTITTEVKQLNDLRINKIVFAQQWATYSVIPLLICAIIAFIQSSGLEDTPKPIVIRNSVLKFEIETSSTKPLTCEHINEPRESPHQPTATATCSCNNGTISPKTPTVPEARVRPRGLERTCPPEQPKNP